MGSSERPTRLERGLSRLKVSFRSQSPPPFICVFEICVVSATKSLFVDWHGLIPCVLLWNIEVKTYDDLLPPGALPGTVPTDYEQATGLERLELLGKMQGIDVFDMKPLDASRKGKFFCFLKQRSCFMFFKSLDEKWGKV